jgi:hypothetical protein
MVGMNGAEMETLPAPVGDTVDRHVAALSCLPLQS